MARSLSTVSLACVAILAAVGCAASNGPNGSAAGTGGNRTISSGGSTGASSGGTGTGGAAVPGSGGGPPSSSGGAPSSGSGGGPSPTTGGNSVASTGGSTGGGTAGGGATGGTGVAGNTGGNASPNGGASGAGSGGSAGTGSPDGGTDGGTSTRPLLSLLGQFSAADVPLRGPMESPPTPRGWTAPATLPVRPGNGIGQHPLLYVGENYNRITMTNEGKVIWTYDTAPGFELDDVWMLSNGHILYTHMTFIEELTPKKQVVWHMNAASGTEIHSCQPIGLDKVLILQNGTPPKAVIINKTTGAIETEHVIPGATAGVHGQFRRMRMTATGTYLISYLDGGKVVEYDKNLATVLWTYVSPRPWSAVRLHNGNTLVQDESQSTSKEVNPQGQVVWQLAKSDIAFPPGTSTGNTQTSERLASGNTVLFTHGVGVNVIQAVEVTPDKKVVWMLQDWIHLGDATAAQFLDEPGIPEVPGDTEH